LTARETPNGTLVNGQKAQKQDLFLGDIVRVGNSLLRLETAGEPAPEAPPPAPPEPAKLPHLTAERLSELTGHTLGHYKMGPVRGRGHCGLVFRAHDLKKDQVVALKVLFPDFPQDDAEMQGFVRAMKTMLALRHPNLLTCLGAGKTGAYCWMALEYVE